MRIPSSIPATESLAATRGADISVTEAAAESANSADATPVVALQSAVLKPAMQAMRNLPEVDHAKVAQLRDALSKGQLPFDPAKLAGLVQRFHGGES
jgi:negative regulator of flagellin synthesis FlgM